jgi:ribosomal protein L37AE/L43A
MGSFIWILMGFIKRKEDFVCSLCKTEVKGKGYTNHCPNCLYSKHLDRDFPGDRQSSCHGILKPVGIETKKGQLRIIHQCQKCGQKTVNKIAENDNFEAILKLARGSEI